MPATGYGLPESEIAAAYQALAEKAQADGYASLDGSGDVPDTEIPDAVARDTEVVTAADAAQADAEATASAALSAHAGLTSTAHDIPTQIDTKVATHAAASDPHGDRAFSTSALGTHEAAADPHAGYQKESEKAAASGYASLDAGSLVVQNPTNAVAAAAASKIPISGSLATLAPAWLVNVVTGITAGTTQTQAGATALTGRTNYIATCANSGDGVKLPAAVAGEKCKIVNEGAQPAKLWPASGDNFTGSAADAACPTLLLAGEWVRFEAKDASTWYDD